MYLSAFHLNKKFHTENYIGRNTLKILTMILESSKARGNNKKDLGIVQQ